VVEMWCIFIFVLATSVTAKFDNICTARSDVKCRGPQDEYTSKYSKGKALIHSSVPVMVRLINVNVKSRIITSFAP
jgi:hypothetical protein